MKVKAVWGVGLIGLALCGCRYGWVAEPKAERTEGLSYPQNCMSATLKDYLAECKVAAKLNPDGECYKADDWMVGPGEMAWERHASYKIVYADKKYMSFWAEEFSYLGGAHGGTKMTVGTMDRETGKVLRAADLIPEQRRVEVRNALEKGIVQHIGKREWLFSRVELTAKCTTLGEGVAT